jgi:hypothetical protein
MENKILIICYDYLPLETPNSFRWSNVAEYWVQQGHDVYIVCAWKPGFQRKEILNGVYVHRVGGIFEETIRRWIMKEHQSIVLNQTQESSHLTVKQRLIVLIKRLHDITWKKIYWPDYACLWFLTAYKKANMLVQHHDVKNLISVSLPFTGHLVGYFIKKKNLKTTWVVDIIDPSFFPDLSYTNNFLLYSKLNRSVEKRVFRNAQAVSVLTKPIQERYSKLYPESRHKIVVNPNLLHYERDTKSSLFPENKKIRLVFVGTLNRTTRSPEHLLQVFEMLLQTKIAERLELHFFGGIEYCVEQFTPYQDLMSKKILLHGHVSREEAIRAMYSADILVNIGNSNLYQEPSKVIEYASIGKQIINIMTIHNDSSALVLEKYPAAMNVFCPMMERKTEQLDKLIKFIKHPSYIEKDFLGKWIMPYTIDTVANTYLLMLDKGRI